MNSLILYAIATTNPELRHTPDGQSRIASFLVQFPAPKQGDPPFRLKVTAWNNLADKAIADIKRDSQVIIEGRLRIDNVDRGTHKEKRTELVAEKIHAIAASSQPTSQPTNYAQSVPVTPIAPQVIQQPTQKKYADILF